LLSTVSRGEEVFNRTKQLDKEGRIRIRSRNRISRCRYRYRCPKREKVQFQFSSFSVVFPFVRPSVSVVVVVQVVRRSAVSVHRFTVSEARERESCPPFRENEEYAEGNREIEANSKERYRRKEGEPAVRVRLNSQMNPVEFLNGCRPADFEKVLFVCCLNT